jgi:hypothetical protein
MGFPTKTSKKIEITWKNPQGISQQTQKKEQQEAI